MRGIDLAFEDLRPIARHMDFHDRHLGIRGRRERRRFERRHGVGRAHVGPDEAAGLTRRIGLVLDLVGDAGCRRLRRHLQDVAVDVDLPAVIEAAQPAFLVAAEHKRGAAVRAVLVEHAEPAVAVAKRHQVLAEQRECAPARRRARRPPRTGSAGIQCRRISWPIGRVALDAAQQFVFFRGHRSPPAAQR